MTKCVRFQEDRSQLPTLPDGNIVAEHIVDEMLKSEETWNTVCSVIRRINEKLRAIEKTRRSNSENGP